MVALMVLLTFAVSMTAFGVVTYVRRRQSIQHALDVTLRTGESELWHHPGHTWVMPVATNRVRIGLDSFSRHLFGKVDGIGLPGIGTELKQGESAFAIRQGERSLAAVAPVTGRVLQLNADPAADSWLCEVEIASPATALKGLFSGNDARNWLQGEFQRVMEIMLGGPAYRERVGMAMPDGGTIVDGLLAEVDDETWNRIAKEVFHSRSAE